MLQSQKQDSDNSKERMLSSGEKGAGPSKAAPEANTVTPRLNGADTVLSSIHHHRTSASAVPLPNEHDVANPVTPCTSAAPMDHKSGGGEGGGGGGEIERVEEAVAVTVPKRHASVQRSAPPPPPAAAVLAETKGSEKGGAPSTPYPSAPSPASRPASAASNLHDTVTRPTRHVEPSSPSPCSKPAHSKATVTPSATASGAYPPSASAAPSAASNGSNGTRSHGGVASESGSLRSRRNGAAGTNSATSALKPGALLGFSV